MQLIKATSYTIKIRRYRSYMEILGNPIDDTGSHGMQMNFTYAVTNYSFIT
jgi:hypothetical protein